MCESELPNPTPGQGFPKLSYYKPRMRAFSYCSLFRSCDKDGGHTIRSAIVENPMRHAKFMASVL